MKKVLYFLSFFLLLTPSTFSQTINAELIGKWEGKGDIIVTWCNLDSLSFKLTIDSTGTVKGMIGDARIAEGAKVEKRSTVMKLLGNGEYIIKGKLVGYLVEKEKIARKGFTLMFSLKNGEINGGMHSTGWKFGGKDKMVLTVSPLHLKKIK